MNCIVPSLNLKVVAKGLQALSKIGDELFIEAKRDKLTLVTLNLRKTVCARLHLFDSFFSSYEVDEDEQNETVTCKIHMKVLLPLLKGTHLEKKFDFIKLEYENYSDILIFKMKYKCDDIIMTHKLKLMDSESIAIQFSADSGRNNILATSSLFTQLLNTFNNTDDEMTLEIAKDKIIARNYITGAPVRPKFVRSQVNSETNINFSLKPIRTAIHFAEGFNLNIGFNFENGGRPLVVIMKNPHLKHIS
ncbi:hypothetical protein NQ317_017308 [Molorchus minor]|uniref:Hus1-like protein n=1 Tax=Molorchus minor TaxID=1323400 RepID=A0ABQ9K2L8_9CUCU|nr:hypothetical protein NQ317_017308 [Molorchus minor]